MSADVTDDAFLGGDLHILQPKAGFRAGLDAVLLAAAAPVSAGSGLRVLDAGSGVGVVGLAVARRVPEARVTLVERDPGLVRLARDNIERNGLSERVRVVQGDVSLPLKDIPELDNAAERFDHVLANPPFHTEGRGTAAGDRTRAAALAMPGGSLERWARFLASMARPGGTASLIHRSDTLGELLAALDGRFGALAVLPVHPRADEPASRVLVQGVKGSRAALRLLPGLVLHGEGNRFQPAVEAVLRHGAALDLRDRHGKS